MLKRCIRGSMLGTLGWLPMVGTYHTIEGETMLKQVGGTLATVGRYVRASHERYDGHGYPDGLIGEAIPLESRIVCACDSHNAMTTDRPYSAARPVSDALAELHRCSGNQFDPTVVDAIDSVLTGHRASAPTRLREPTKFELLRAERGRA
jgi:HD-GYP domain-containing protein (c-di-GMP phosphodiesterase class II)